MVEAQKFHCKKRENSKFIFNNLTSKMFPWGRRSCRPIRKVKMASVMVRLHWTRGFLQNQRLQFCSFLSVLHTLNVKTFVIPIKTAETHQSDGEKFVCQVSDPIRRWSDRLQHHFIYTHLCFLFLHTHTKVSITSEDFTLTSIHFLQTHTNHQKTDIKTIRL